MDGYQFIAIVLAIIAIERVFHSFLLFLSRRYKKE